MSLGNALKGQGSGFDFEHPLKVSGGLNAGMGFYSAFGAPSRRDPFAYNLQANISFKLLGQIDMPFSASFSQQESNFAQPFNQYGISPKYKWITTHIGYRSMSFSDFTLAGHTFLGGGVELAPGNWKVSAMYGRLRRAVDEESALLESATPSYKRMGYGVMVGYSAKGDNIEVAMFKATDVLNSIPTPEASPDVTPEDGLSIGIKGKKKIAKKLDIEAEYARSAVTRDVRSPELSDGGGLAYFGPFYTQRSSSAVHPAYQGKINYKAKKYTASLKYRRVDTDFRTLGAYFFTNDTEDATLNLNTTLLKGKLSFSGSAGGQRNDLQSLKATRSSRFVGSLNLGYNPNEKWSFSLSGSNFSSFLKVDRNILSDSLNFYQVTRNASFSLVRNLGSDSTKQTIAANMSYQNAVGRKEYSVEPENANDFYNIALSHNLKSKPLKMDFSTMFSYTYTIMPNQTTAFFGPSFGVSKSLLGKKLKTSLRSSFQTVMTNGAVNSMVLTARINGTYQLGKHHGISAGTDFLHKEAKAATATTFNELRGTMGYTFNF